jgi:hypothetical protein
MCIASLSVVVGTILQKPSPVRAATYGNTDIYESADCPPAPFPQTQCQPRTCNLTSPIWSGATCVTQRYGCIAQTQYAEAVTPSSPLYQQACLSLPISWRFWHHGIDVGAPAIGLGTWLYSPISGRVEQNDLGVLGIRDLSGHVIYLVHGDSQVSSSSLVTVGQHIVNAACHGSCSATHLHLEVHSSLLFNQSGGPTDDINPEPWLQYQGPRAATVSSAFNRLDVFVRGTTGGAYQVTANGTSGSWGTTLQLTPAGTTFAGQLSAVSNATNQIFLYGIGSDGNLYQNYATNNTNWNGWTSLDRHPNGVWLIGTPAAVTWASQQNLSIFARGTDGALYHRVYSPSGWSSWEYHGGYATTDPSAISPGSNRLDVFTLGDLAHNGHTYHHWYSGTSWQPVGALCNGLYLCGYDDWGAAPTTGSNFVAQPTAGSTSASYIDAFATSADGNLYTKHLLDATNWTDWQSMGNLAGLVIGAPAGADFVRSSSTAISASVRTTDGGGNTCWLNPTTCDRIGGLVTNDPGAISIGANQLDLFFRGGADSTFALWHRQWTNYGGGPPTWGNWENWGGSVS